MSDLERIAYDNAIRALDKQEKLLEELRARTGILLAASSLAASLLGGRAFDDVHPIILLIAALTAFVVSLGACLFVLLPRENFVFALDGAAVYERLYPFRDDEAEIHRRLAYDLRGFLDQNDVLLQPVSQAFRVAAASLVIEVLALTLLVAGIL